MKKTAHQAEEEREDMAKAGRPEEAPLAAARQDRRRFRHAGPAALAALFLATALGLWLKFGAPSDGVDLALAEAAPSPSGPVSAEDQAASEAIMAEVKTSRIFVGNIRPGKLVAAAAGIGGYVTRLEESEVGVLVEKGDLLAVLDSTDAEKEMLQAKIAAVEAKLEYLKLQNWSNSTEMREAERAVQDAERSVNLAKRKSAQSKQLLDDGIIAGSEYELELETYHQSQAQLMSAIARRDDVEAQANDELLEVARQRLDIANADYASIKETVKNSDVRAPIGGILLPAPSKDRDQQEISVGQVLEKGTPLFLIGNLDDLVVKTSVSEFDVDLIKTGQKAIISSEALPDVRMTGVVESVSLFSSTFGNEYEMLGRSAPSRYDVVIRIAARDPSHPVRIGMTVDVEIDIGDDDDALAHRQP